MKLDYIKALKNNKLKIILLPHARPDADAMGSSVALAILLKSIGHQVKIISATEYPSFLNWMIKGVKVEVSTKENHGNNIKKELEESDLIICLDFSSLNRINALESLVRDSPSKKLVIDHHPDPDDFTQNMIWDPSASATAVIIYRIISEMGLLDSITSHMANCLYAGIMTDTGSFQHPNTTSEAHSISCDLISKGADVSMVSKNIYNSSSLNKIKFWGFAFTDRLFVMEDYHTAYFAIKKSDWDKYNLQTGDTEGLVNYALSIENIYYAALISDKGDMVRLSLRSIGDNPVNTIAQKYFNGGGHKNAAGGKSDQSLDETVKKFQKVVKENFKIKKYE